MTPLKRSLPEVVVGELVPPRKQTAMPRVIDVPMELVEYDFLVRTIETRVGGAGNFWAAQETTQVMERSSSMIENRLRGLQH